MEIQRVRELIFWSYANLAMAHAAINGSQSSYSRVSFSIRARLYKGLMTGKMSLRTLFDDEKVKMFLGYHCAYCGGEQAISIDHIFPQKNGGTDAAENLICACKSCNSSKGAKDMVEWFVAQHQFPPLFLLRRYLKLVYQFCETHQLLDLPVAQVDDTNFPFKFKFIPLDFPPLTHLTLYK